MSLTLDILSNYSIRSYLGITCNYINDFKLLSAMLACTRFRASHSDEHILLKCEEIISALELQGKVGCNVTDNASNMLGAFVTLPGKDAIEFEDDSDDNELETIDMAHNNCTNAFEYLPTHYPCFANTLQLCVETGLKGSGDHVGRVINKVSKFVSHIRHSILATELFENELKLEQCTPVRWNSQLNMKLKFRKVSNETMEKLEYSNKLSSYENKILD